MSGDLREGRIVIVGASLAGVRAVETLREEGFAGSPTVVGDEPHPPYDRSPLGVSTFSDQVLVAQGSLEERRLVMAYGHRGRVTAAVTVDMAKSLECYERLVETGRPVPAPAGRVGPPHGGRGRPPLRRARAEPAVAPSHRRAHRVPAGPPAGPGEAHRVTRPRPSTRSHHA